MSPNVPSATSLPKLAWVTLVTRGSYLPGAILLAYSLQRSQSKYPLIILTTPSFPESLVDALRKECEIASSIHYEVESLSPPLRNLPLLLIAERFADTWTKLRVFELYKYGCEKLVFLDADMLVKRNMDELLDVSLPADWIAANHVCVCNLDHDSWAPKTWTRENCAYTGLTHNSPPASVPTRSQGKYEHTLLNSGLFIFTPFKKQWDSILHFLSTNEKIRSYMFPDQDFLAEFFEGRWKSISWKYNALKTMRYWHTNVWEDEEVRNLHYIVDKPWNRRIGPDGIAGYLGKDGITHQWWWEAFQDWERDRGKSHQDEILEVMKSEVARPL